MPQSRLRKAPQSRRGVEKKATQSRMLTRPGGTGVRVIYTSSIPGALGRIGSTGRLTNMILGSSGSSGRLNSIIRTLGSIDSEQAARSPMKRTAGEVPARNAVVVVVKPAAAVAAIKLISRS